jgi:hypothetical protein
MKLNLDKLVSGGMPPWQPSQAARDVEVWHRYDFPLAGTYKLQEHLILFTVIGDTSENLSVWAYVPVTGADRARVDDAEFGSPSEMRVFIEDMFAGREAAFALAKNLQVWKWARQQVPSSEDGLLKAATEALTEMVKAITAKREPPSPDVIFRAELAQAEVTTDDLVDA